MKTIGFAFTGSFCTYSKVFPVLSQIAEQHQIIPIMSYAAAETDTRFGTAADHIQKIREICHAEPIRTLRDAEPIGPQKLLDALIVAPCTGNTLAKLACGISDTPVTLAVKSHLRNGRPVLIAISTNDGLSGACENISRLLNRKHYYFVPFEQDNPSEKPSSLVADFAQIPQSLSAALGSRQLPPLIKK